MIFSTEKGTYELMERASDLPLAEGSFQTLVIVAKLFGMDWTRAWGYSQAMRDLYRREDAECFRILREHVEALGCGST